MMSKTRTWVGKAIAGRRFRVVEKLGEGGMATVYRAFDTLRQLEVVLKVPRPAYLEDRALLRRFSLELRSLAQLRHPHILPIHEMVVHDDAPVAVMPYLSGGTLRQRRAEFGKGTTLQDALQCWLPAIAEAIDYVHSQGYLHRDVKPTNILFDERGNAVLGDFGIVRVLSEQADSEQEKLTGTGMVLGTPEYMAPELIVGAECDGRADQYSLAVTAYEMMCGPVLGGEPGGRAHESDFECSGYAVVTVPPLPSHGFGSGTQSPLEATGGSLSRLPHVCPVPVPRNRIRSKGGPAGPAFEVR